MDQNEIEKKLFTSDSNKYGDKYIEHLLEQYKIYISAAGDISEQRQKSNEFFLGLNTALVALLGFVVTKTSNNEVTWLLALSSIAGITTCYLWYRIIMSYRGLNSGKYKIIHAIEARLPMALYDTEWELLGRGKKKNLYWPFTHIEWKIPWIFIAIYSLLFLYTIPWVSMFCVLGKLIYIY